MPACFEPLCHCPLDVANRGQVMGQQFGLAFDEIGTSQRRNTEVRVTHRWRKTDSNSSSPAIAAAIAVALFASGHFPSRRRDRLVSRARSAVRIPPRASLR
jgi:hypothetical protein